MAKVINNLTEVTSISSSDEFLVSRAGGANDVKIKHGNLFVDVCRNDIFRGKNLGTVTAANIESFITSHGISTGVFTDIYVGDYFTISYAGANKIIRVAGFDTFLRCGDSEFSKHHVICVPDGNLVSSVKMNSTDTSTVSENAGNPSTKGGYVGSDIWNITIPEINTELEKVFGTHLLTHREWLSNSVDVNANSVAYSGWTGIPNNGEWVDVKATLLSEIEVFGGFSYGASAYNSGISNRSIPLFSIEPKYSIGANGGYWLKDVCSRYAFTCVNADGRSDYANASTALGIRPRWYIG